MVCQSMEAGLYLRYVLCALVTSFSGYNEGTEYLFNGLIRELFQQRVQGQTQLCLFKI